MIDTDIVIKTHLWNLDNIYDDILCELEQIESRCEFVLKKYTWDRKKAYQTCHTDMVRETRDTLATVLLKIRDIKKLNKE